MEIFLAIIGLVVGFAVGVLVMRNNYKKFRDLELEITKNVNFKKLTREELINLLRDKLNI